MEIAFVIVLHQQGHGRRHQTQPGPMDPMRPKVTRIESIMCNGEIKIHPKGEREEERGAQCILKRPPASYQPIAASLGAGPGEPDSARTIRRSRGKSSVYSYMR